MLRLPPSLLPPSICLLQRKYLGVPSSKADSTLSSRGQPGPLFLVGRAQFCYEWSTVWFLHTTPLHPIPQSICIHGLSTCSNAGTNENKSSVASLMKGFPWRLMQLMPPSRLPRLPTGKTKYIQITGERSSRIHTLQKVRNIQLE